MKLLQLNIEAGKLLPEIIQHLKANDYDFLCLQELTNGERFQMKYATNGTGNITEFPSQDCFLELEKQLPDYKGVLAKSFADVGGNNYFGSAIFYKNRFNLVNSQELLMGESRLVSIVDTNKDCDWPALPYKALALEFQDGEQKFQIVTGHFTWTPRSYDTDLSVSRAKVVYDYLTETKLPFVLTGDFNVNYNTTTCRQFEPIARNIGAQLRIRNSINPEKHRATWLFPEGIPCDQVFTSYDIDIYGFQLLRKTLSDHYGLELDFELSNTTQQPIGGLFEYSH